MFLEKAKDPKFWERVRTDEEFASFRADLLEIYKKDALKPIEEVPYTVAADFFISGDRVKGESIIHSRKRALTASACLALIYPDKQEYLDRLQDFIFAYCNEYSWELPAHIPNMTDYIPCDIDLAAAEKAFALSEIYVIFEDRLAPLIKTRLKMEIERRIILPFMDDERTFPWLDYHSNWASVCGAGVAAAFMYLFPERFDVVRPKIDHAMASFMRSYRESGYCYEGIGYWEYGFGHFIFYAQMLYDFTNGKENLFESEKVKAIASFPQKAFLSGDALVSFSDGKRNGALNRGMCHFLAHKYPDTVFPMPQKEVPVMDVTGRWGHALRNFVWFDATTEKAQDVLCDYSTDAQWLIYRTPEFGFAAKGGCNWEAHNHNDVGSFIFATGGKQALVDLGAGEYTRQYFVDEVRYTFFNPSSRSHNLPILFGQYQKPGRNRRANGTTYDGKTLSFDYASAYDIPEVTSLIRTFTPDKGGVTVTDEITYADGITAKKGDFVERFVFTEKPVIDGNRVTAAGAVLTLTGVEENPTLTCQTIPQHNCWGPPYDVFTLDFTVTDKKFELRVEIEK